MKKLSQRNRLIGTESRRKIIMMKITLKDGSVKEYAESKSVNEIALDIREGLARSAC